MFIPLGLHDHQNTEHYQTDRSENTQPCADPAARLHGLIRLCAVGIIGFTAYQLVHRDIKVFAQRLQLIQLGS